MESPFINRQNNDFQEKLPNTHDDSCEIDDNSLQQIDECYSPTLPTLNTNGKSQSSASPMNSFKQVREQKTFLNLYNNIQSNTEQVKNIIHLSQDQKELELGEGLTSDIFKEINLLSGEGRHSKRSILNVQRSTSFNIIGASYSDQQQSLSNNGLNYNQLEKIGSDSSLIRFRNLNRLCQNADRKGSGTLESKDHYFDKGLDQEIEQILEDVLEENQSISLRQNTYQRNSRYSYDITSQSNLIKSSKDMRYSYINEVQSDDDIIDIKHIQMGQNIMSNSKNQTIRKDNQAQLNIQRAIPDTNQQQLFILKQSSFDDAQANLSTPKFGFKIQNQPIQEKDLSQQKQNEQSQEDLPAQLLNRLQQSDFFDQFTLKFIYKNEKEKQIFMENYEKTILLYNKYSLFGFGDEDSSKSSGEEKKLINNVYEKQLLSNPDLFEKKKTLVICDIHRLLLFIRTTQESHHDIVIRTKMRDKASNPYFYISLRNRVIKFLTSLYQHFAIVVYVPNEDEVASLILDHLEKLCDLQGKLFTIKLYSKDCERSSHFEHLKIRNLNLIIDEEIECRKPENVVCIGVGFEEMANNLKCYIPVKTYEGKKKDKHLTYLQDYLINNILPAEDVREVIKKDFISQIKIRKYHKLTL
eukprot:403334178